VTRNPSNQRLNGITDWSLNEVIAVEKVLNLKPGILLDAAQGKGLIEILSYDTTFDMILNRLTSC
jgi:hypothetical protein